MGTVINVETHIQRKIDELQHEWEHAFDKSMQFNSLTKFHDTREATKKAAEIRKELDKWRERARIFRLKSDHLMTRTSMGKDWFLGPYPTLDIAVDVPYSYLKEDYEESLTETED